MILDSTKGLTRGSEKRVRLKCDDCNTVTTSTYGNYFQSQKKREFSGKTFCNKCAVKIAAKKRRGVPSWNKGLKLPNMAGKNHPRWNGGQYVSRDGYNIVQVKSGRAPDEPAWKQYQREHKVVVEKKLGRKLKRSETIHHIDGDKLNNKISNLFVTSQSQHRSAHQSLQEIGYELLRLGLIKFRRKDGKYIVASELESLCTKVK